MLNQIVLVGSLGGDPEVFFDSGVSTAVQRIKAHI